jgi:hypothetical protein
LPPPAFPPGLTTPSRANHRSPPPGPGDGEGDVPAEAFILPEEPITDSRIGEDTFTEMEMPFSDDEEVDPDEVLVTGIGDDPHLGGEELTLSPSVDPVVADLALRVGRLAEALRTKGQAALKTTPDMNRFEMTLRAYCVGYLAGQRDAGEG